VLTHRGRLSVALGLGVYAAAWAFGSQPLYPVAIGLLLATLGARLWVGSLTGPLSLRRRARGEHLEGDDVDVALELTSGGVVRPAAIRVVERTNRLGGREAIVRRRTRGVLAGRYRLRAVPRGRYRFESATAIVEDPFGLARREVSLDAPGALLVLPRLVHIEGLFSESGSRANEGKRLLLRRPAGFDVHSVREYERGESLRKVHWRSTAHRGQLMVKELEDAPRDEVAVVLDASARAVAGTPPDSTFDLQVRAAGSVLRAHALRGRRTVLVVTSQERELRRLGGDGGAWRTVLEALAAAEPDGTTPVASVLAGEASVAAQALDLVVVTAELAPELADRLLRRATARRGTSLVLVDRASFLDGRGGAGVARDPLVLRVRAAGIPVAVVRRGDDLASVLGRRNALRRASDG
jgi:uncharacterized protein (DUF58 family)